MNGLWVKVPGLQHYAIFTSLSIYLSESFVNYSELIVCALDLLY